MSNNPFRAKSPPSALTEELDARKDATATQYWFASRSNWVRVVSMCGRPGCNVLIGTESSSNVLYNGNYNGDRPKPVVTAVKVSSTGTIGSTRTATISVLAFNEQQLEYVSDCFLRSDMSVRVEFGWSTPAVRNKPAPGPVTNLRNITDSEAICLINTQRDSNPCYDGLQGRVGKWKINYNKDNMIWEIQIDLVASSSPVLNLPVQDFTNSCRCEQKQQNAQGETENVVTVTSRFKAFLQELIRIASEDSNAQSKLDSHVKKNIQDGKAYAIHLNGALRDEIGGTPGWFDSTTSFFSRLGSLVPLNTEESDEAFITLETFFKCIQKLSFTQDEGGEGSIYCTFDLSSVSQATRKKNGPIYSSDPHACLLPGGDFAGGSSTGDIVGAFSLYGGGALANVGEGYRGISRAESCVSENYVDLGKILVNVIFIHKCLYDLGKNATIQDLVDRVLTGINEAVGNLWELSIVDNTSCDDKPKLPNLVLIDLNVIKPGKPYNVSVTAYDKDGRLVIPTLVRDVKMELQLSSAMQTQALYADIKGESYEDKCNQVRMKRDQLGYPNLAAPRPKKKGASDFDCGEKCDNEEQGKSILEQLQEAYENLRDEVTEANKSTLYSKLVEYYNDKPEDNQCATVILPYEVSLTFDGIGGFAFGQVLTVDALPQKYRDKFMYQIVAVEHDVNYGDWITTVKMKPRPIDTTA